MWGALSSSIISISFLQATPNNPPIEVKTLPSRDNSIHHLHFCRKLDSETSLAPNVIFFLFLFETCPSFQISLQAQPLLSISSKPQGQRDFLQWTCLVRVAKSTYWASPGKSVIYCSYCRKHPKLSSVAPCWQPRKTNKKSSRALVCWRVQKET